jgi:hypothetical protein
MLDRSDRTEGAEREARSFPRLLEELLGLKQQTAELTTHVRAVCSILGIPAEIDVKTRPKSGEETAPMVRVFEAIEETKSWMTQIDKKLHRALDELIPDFYENLKKEAHP